MKRNNEFNSIIGRAFRLLPAFFISSLGGCLLARFGFGIAWDQVAVAVAVPVAGMFSIAKILFITTYTEDEPTKKPDKVAMLLIATFVFGVLLALDFLVSSAIFRYLGMLNLISGCLQIAAISALIAFASLVFAAVHISRDILGRLSDAVHALIVFGISRTQMKIVQVVRSPARMLHLMAHRPY
jgi:hypothetical protein